MKPRRTDKLGERSRVILLLLISTSTAIEKMFNQKLLPIEPSIAALSLVSLIVKMGTSIVNPSRVHKSPHGRGARRVVVGAGFWGV